MTRRKGTSKIYKLNPNARTIYLSIPAELTKEEGFPFKAGDMVEIELDIKKQIVIISKFD